MPYIKKHHKKWIDDHIQNLNEYIGTDPGIMNYTITKLCIGSMPHRYRDYNRLIGVLECVKQELYRRAIAPYEDEKIKENGDVYEKLKTDLIGRGHKL